MWHRQQDQSSSQFFTLSMDFVAGAIGGTRHGGAQGLGRVGGGAFVCMCGKWEGALGSQGLSRPLAWS